MTIAWIIIVGILLYIIYVIKLALDLDKYKDNLLRGLAGVDAIIIKKNAVILDILGYAKEFMDKDQHLVNAAYAIRYELNKLKPRIDNADKRYEVQKKYDKQVELIVQAVNRYKDLKTNAGLQAQLRQLAILEEAQNEKLLYYNDAVDRMNWYINTFPSSIIAQINEVKPPPPRYDR